MDFQLYLPNGQSWEIKNPNLANRSSIITTCVRRYYFENTYYTLLACVDYHVPDKVFYDFTVTRQEGTFPLSSQRDYEILHYMIEAYPIPLSHYIECEKKLQHMASKIKHMQGMTKDLVADMKTRANKSTDRKVGTHVANVEYHTANRAPKYAPENSTASCIVPASPPNIKNWDSKFKQMQRMAKDVYVNYMKRRTNEDMDKKSDATIANVVQAKYNSTKQTPEYAPQKAVSSFQTPATLQKLKDLASKLEYMQELYTKMKKGTHKNMDREVNDTIANVEKTEYHTAKQTTEFQTTSRTAVATHQSPVTPPNIRNWDTKFSHMQKMAKDIYADFMKNRTHEGACVDKKKR